MLSPDVLTFPTPCRPPPTFRGDPFILSQRQAPSPSSPALNLDSYFTKKGATRRGRPSVASTCRPQPRTPPSRYASPASGKCTRPSLCCTRSLGVSPAASLSLTPDFQSRFPGSPVGSICRLCPPSLHYLSRPLIPPGSEPPLLFPRDYHNCFP